MNPRNTIQKSALLLGALGLLTGMVACSTTNASKPLAPAMLIRAEMPRADYKILNTVEGKGEVRRFLCLFTLGDTQFGYTSQGGSALLGLGNLQVRDAVAAATYDAISKVPEADMMLPLTTMTSKTGLGCLYSTNRATVRGKAIRIRNK